MRCVKAFTNVKNCLALAAAIIIPESRLDGVAALVLPDVELLALEDQVLAAYLQPARQRSALPVTYTHLGSSSYRVDPGTDTIFTYTY